MSSIKTIERKIHNLPPQFIDDLNEYVDFLLSISKDRGGHRLQQNWAGALKDFSDEYTSVELQN